MTTNNMKFNEKTVDKIVKSLGVFVAFTFVWVISDLLSQIVNPLGLFSSLAAISFLLTVAALSYVLISAGTLYFQLS